MPTIVLPEIKRIILHGFAPLFENNVKINLPSGPFLILGGNAMGKTTTLQAIIFALTGGADSEIQEEKSRRWDAEYFRNRLTREQDSEVEVEIMFGDVSITVLRSITPSRVVGVRINGEWNHDAADAEVLFEQAVTEAGHYKTFSDFRFLLHRLCYLPETRQSLVWDHRAQIRVLMLVCYEADKEAKFRALSRLLRSLDTEKRHLHVDITHLKQRLDQTSLVPKKAAVKPQDGDTTAKIEALRRSIDAARSQRSSLHTEASTLRSRLSATAAELEELQIELSSQEDSFILKTLRTVENSASAIALQKLLVYHVCPYCAQHADHLAATAQAAVTAGSCPLCEQSYASSQDLADIPRLRSRLVELTSQRNEVEQSLRDLNDRSHQLTEKEAAAQEALELLVARLPRIPAAPTLKVNMKNAGSIRTSLLVYERRYADLERRWELARKAADEAFEVFTQVAAIRLDDLRRKASAYGGQFLGRECEFSSVIYDGDLSEMKLLVPMFAEKVRKTPEQCSESERFFLDIGFRMAVIELAGQLSETTSTFICETPENALDLAYTDNVAAMFERFVKRSFSLLMTANIQVGGVARPLLARYASSQRSRRVFNMLEEGDMSAVQDKKLATFKGVMKRILGGASVRAK